METVCSNLYLDLLTKLNYSSNIIPFIGHISDTAQIFLRLSRKTNEFWKENLEIISCVILKNEKFKLNLEFMNEFDEKGAQLLLKYRTYLLYNVDLIVGPSKESFEQFKFFLDNIPKIPEMFNYIEFKLTKDNLDVYNQHVKAYIEMGFPTSVIDTNFKNRSEFIDDATVHELEFHDVAKDQVFNKFKYKLVERQDLRHSSMTVEEVAAIDYKFRSCLITLTNIGKLISAKFTFGEDQSKYCTRLVIGYCELSSSIPHSEIQERIEYMLECFPNIKKITYMGSKLTTSKFFESINHFQTSRMYDSLEYGVEKSLDSYVGTEDTCYPGYRVDIPEDFTKFSLLNNSFAYFYSKTEDPLICEARNYDVSCLNSGDWLQIGDYVFIFNFYRFHTSSVKLINDKERAKKLRALVNDNDMQAHSSFLVIKTSHKLYKSDFDCIKVTNEVSISGHCLAIKYKSIFAENVESLLSIIMSIPPQTEFGLDLDEFLDFSKEIVLNLFRVLSKRVISRLIFANNIVYKTEAAQEIIKFLSMPTTRITSLSIALNDPKDVLPILKTQESKFNFYYAEILTTEPVDQETEDFAESLIESHIGCVLELNSKRKLIRPMNDRGVVIYY